eukprot:6025808-Alexandrium_andersonii.AAC.1
MDNVDTHTAAERLTRCIRQHASSCIPQREVSFRSSHPWLTAHCLQLVREKCDAVGTEHFAAAAEACSAALLQAHCSD